MSAGIQYIGGYLGTKNMGHLDISVNINLYMHIRFNDAEKEVRRMTLWLRLGCFSMEKRIRMMFFHFTTIATINR